MGVGRGPSSRVGEETGSALEDIRGIGGEETTAETNGVDSTPRTPQDILGDFAEDWLETLDKNEIKSISLFLCYHFVRAFSFTETKAAEYAASMMKKSDRTVRRWRSALIDDGVLPESEQGRYQRSGVLWQNEEWSKKAVKYVVSCPRPQYARTRRGSGNIMYIQRVVLNSGMWRDQSDRFVCNHSINAMYILNYISESSVSHINGVWPDFLLETANFPAITINIYCLL